MSACRNRTRQKIKDAFKVLLKDQSPLQITVSDLCLKCKINRSTFYQYYPYIDKLIEDVIQDELIVNAEMNKSLLDSFYLTHSTSPSQIEEYLVNFTSNEVIRKFIKSSDSDYFRLLIVKLEIRYEFKKYHIVTQEDRATAINRNYGVFAVIFAWIDKVLDVNINEISQLIYKFLRR